MWYEVVVETTRASHKLALGADHSVRAVPALDPAFPYRGKRCRVQGGRELTVIIKGVVVYRARYTGVTWETAADAKSALEKE